MDMIERVARAMYWDRVNPDIGTVMLDVAVVPWEDLADENRPGIQVWRCQQFWRDAARAAIEAMREPTFNPENVSYHQGMTRADWWRAMVDAALAAPPVGG